jgi:hypothetical protein
VETGLPPGREQIPENIAKEVMNTGALQLSSYPERSLARSRILASRMNLTRFRSAIANVTALVADAFTGD